MTKPKGNAGYATFLIPGQVTGYTKYIYTSYTLTCQGIKRLPITLGPQCIPQSSSDNNLKRHHEDGETTQNLIENSCTGIANLYISLRETISAVMFSLKTMPAINLFICKRHSKLKCYVIS